MKNIFHIGYHKTASTWFQSYFYPKVNNYLYVKRDNIRDHFYKGIPQDFPKDCDLIFCDEELSGNIHNGGLSGFLSKDVANKITDFQNPKVVILIRNQYDIIVSSYLQYIKKGGNYSLDAYLYHQDFPDLNRSPLFSFSHFNYLDKINTYEKLIGKENVFVYLYEDFKENPKDFLKTFIHHHNFEVDLEHLNFEETNKSYSYLSLFLSRFLNSFTRKSVLYKYYIFHIPYLYDIRSRIIKLLNYGNINYLNFLGKNNRDYIHTMFSDKNKILQDLYDLDLEKHNYPL